MCQWDLFDNEALTFAAQSCASFLSRLNCLVPCGQRGSALAGHSQVRPVKALSGIAVLVSSDALDGTNCTQDIG